jgi:hypothetical protein
MADEKSRVFGTWYGGHSYSSPYTDSDLEAFESMEAAKDALIDRYESNGYRQCFFDYVNRDAEDTYVPVVSDDSEIWVYYADPTHTRDSYPDAVIKLRQVEGELTAYVEPC